MTDKMQIDNNMDEQLLETFTCPICFSNIDEVNSDAEKRNICLYRCDCPYFVCDTCIDHRNDDQCPGCRKDNGYVSIGKNKHRMFISQINDVVQTVRSKYSHVEKFLTDNPNIKEISDDLMATKLQLNDKLEKLASDEKSMFETMKMYERDVAIIENTKAAISREKANIMDQTKQLETMIRESVTAMEKSRQKENDMKRTIDDMSKKMAEANSQLTYMRNSVEQYKKRAQELEKRPAVDNEEVSSVKRELEELRELIRVLVKRNPGVGVPVKS